MTNYVCMYEDLKLKIIAEWSKIDGEILNNLYKSMKDRILKLTSSKGDYQVLSINIFSK